MEASFPFWAPDPKTEAVVLDLLRPSSSFYVFDPSFLAMRVEAMFRKESYLTLSVTFVGIIFSFEGSFEISNGTNSSTFSGDFS